MGILLRYSPKDEVMRKLSAVVILLFALCLSTKAQSADSTRQFLSDLEKTNSDSVRLKLLVKLGSNYLHRPGEVKSDLDSADLFLDQAKKLSAKLKSSKIQNMVLFLQAEVLFERGDKPKARIAYLHVIDNYRRSDEKEEEAQVWFTMGVRLMYSSDSTGFQGLHAYEHALSLYTEVHNKEKEAEVIKNIGDRFLRQGQLDEAENELLQTLNIYKSIGYKKLHYTYDLLAGISTRKGNLNKALYYALEMLKSIQATGDTARAYYWYKRLADVYENLKDYEKSKYWYNRALINSANYPELFFPINNSIIGIMLREGKKKEALEFLLKLIKKHPPVSDADKLGIASSLGDCYSLLGKDELAEKHYQEAVVIAKRTLWKYNIMVADKDMSDFYISRKRYATAGIYLHELLALPRGTADVETIRDTYLELFKADSASGHYLSAINNYQHYKLLTDSIFTVAKARQITQLQLQFEKDQQVKQLESKGKLQQTELHQTVITRNFIIAGAGVLFLFLVMGYRRYRQKQSSNRLLQEQQRKINSINQSLRLMVDEKDSLLKEKDILLSEKDWLLKEVHHRVKNNLHTIICLLESQAAYLQDDALKAVEISQHRIYAMSLIHQKLYLSEDIKMIDMDLYIDQFVKYLADSFGPPANIAVRSAVEPLKLGVSQAIPLGLILNEAVTNAFKYAFPDNKAGGIFIGLKQTNNLVELVIADDGIGIPHQVDENEPQSLGIELIKGLTRDLKGSITFDISNGTRITVIFAVDSLDKSGTTGMNSKNLPLAYEN
jgi:two-component sensor histidine kinase